jgi:hypothetical protein
VDWKARLPVLASALWWGSLTAIGFVAVPLLFSNASSPAVAGTLAAHLFRGQAWLSLGCGLLILMSARDREGTATIGWAGGAVAYVLPAMLCALLQEFAVAPKIVAREDLAWWHSAGTGLYAAQWLCALVVLWKLTGAPAPEGAISRPGTS